MKKQNVKILVGSHLNQLLSRAALQADGRAWAELHLLWAIADAMATQRGTPWWAPEPMAYEHALEQLGPPPWPPMLPIPRGAR